MVKDAASKVHNAAKKATFAVRMMKHAVARFVALMERSVVATGVSRDHLVFFPYSNADTFIRLPGRI